LIDSVRAAGATDERTTTFIHVRHGRDSWAMGV
jgi:hypothetical protein